MNHTKSGNRGAKLATGIGARTARVERALSRAGVHDDVHEVTATKQASASIAKVRGMRILVSYETAVAFIDAYGQAFTCTRNYWSRTTQASIDAFCSHRVEYDDEAKLHARLLLAMTTA